MRVIMNQMRALMNWKLKKLVALEASTAVRLVVVKVVVVSAVNGFVVNSSDIGSIKPAY